MDGVSAEILSVGMTACGGCARYAFVLRVVDDAKLCDDCAEKAARIDQQLVGVQPTDPVDCDGCGDHVAVDARAAVVARECGGIVLCLSCKPITAPRATS